MIYAIDDDCSITDMLKMLFKNENIKIFNSGSLFIECMNNINKKHPSVLIIDLKMPNISGEDIFYNYRNLDFFYYMPIIFLTANNDIYKVKKLIKDNAFDYILKSLNYLEFKNNIITSTASAIKESENILTKYIHPIDSLTYMEKLVLSKILENKSTDEITSSISKERSKKVSFDTIQKHRSNISKKIGFSQKEIKDIECKALKDNFKLNIKDYVKCQLDQKLP